MEHCIIVSDEGYFDLNPIYFGYENCEKSKYFGPSVRTHWLIHFVVSGFGIFRIQGREYNVKPGEMFVIPPYIETYYEADNENPWSYIWIGFTTRGDLPKPLADIVKCPEAFEVFNKMKECEAFSSGRSAYLAARLWDLFSLLSGRENSRDDYVKAALNCIHTEYMYGLTVEEIAKRLNLDRTYFSTLFKKRTGASPKQYLLDYRMSIAASLILKKDIPVSVAAYSVGYSDIFTFSKMFKRHFGISPREYSKGKRNQRM